MTKNTSIQYEIRKRRVVRQVTYTALLLCAVWACSMYAISNQSTIAALLFHLSWLALMVQMLFGLVPAVES